MDLVPEEGSSSLAERLAERQMSALSVSNGQNGALASNETLDDSDRFSGKERIPDEAPGVRPKKVQTGMDEREKGDIELASPIRLSKQAKEIIAKLRRMKDEQEDWVK